MKNQKQMTRRLLSSENRARTGAACRSIEKSAAAPASDAVKTAGIFQAVLVTCIGGTPRWLAENMHQLRLKRP